MRLVPTSPFRGFPPNMVVSSVVTSTSEKLKQNSLELGPSPRYPYPAAPLPRLQGHHFGILLPSMAPPYFGQFVEESAKQQFTQTVEPLARTAYSLTQRSMPMVKEKLSSWFPRTLGLLYPRAKSLQSIIDKLAYRLETQYSTIDQLQNTSDILNSLKDGIGFRLVLLPQFTQDAKPSVPGTFGKSTPLEIAMDRTIDQIVKKLTEQQNPKAPDYIELWKVENYAATDTGFYLKPHHIKALRKAASDQGIDLEVTEDLKHSGYTDTQLYFRFPNQPTPFPVELQIRGPLVDALSQMEHHFYKAKQRLALSKWALPRYEHTENNQWVEKFEMRLMSKLSELAHHPELEQQFKTYIQTCYIQARLQEQHPDALFPLPHYPKDLKTSFGNLFNFHFIIRSPIGHSISRRGHRWIKDNTPTGSAKTSRPSRPFPINKTRPANVR